VTMKIRLRPFRTHTRSRTLAEPTNDVAVIRAVAAELLDRFEIDAPVRLLGVGMAGLSQPDAVPEWERAAAAGEPQPLALELNSRELSTAPELAKPSMSVRHRGRIGARMQSV
jgi:DNA polymerase IV